MDRRAGRIVAAFAAPESRLALRAASRQLWEAVDAECAEQLRVRAPEAAGRAFPLRVLLACARPGACAVDTRPFVWLQRLLPAGDLPELTPVTFDPEDLEYVDWGARQYGCGFEEEWRHALALALSVLGEYRETIGAAMSELVHQVQRAGLGAHLAAHLAIALFAQPTRAQPSLFLTPDDPQARWIREQAGCGERPPEVWRVAEKMAASERMCFSLKQGPRVLDVVSGAAAPDRRLLLLDALLYAELCVVLATAAPDGDGLLVLRRAWQPRGGAAPELPAEVVRIALAAPCEVDDERVESDWFAAGL